MTAKTLKWFLPQEGDDLTQTLLEIAYCLDPSHISTEFTRQQILEREREYAKAQDWCTFEARRLMQERKP